MGGYVFEWPQKVLDRSHWIWLFTLVFSFLSTAWHIYRWTRYQIITAAAQQQGHAETGNLLNELHNISSDATRATWLGVGMALLQSFSDGPIFWRNISSPLIKQNTSLDSKEARDALVAQPLSCDISVTRCNSYRYQRKRACALFNLEPAVSVTKFCGPFTLIELVDNSLHATNV